MIMSQVLMIRGTYIARAQVYMVMLQNLIRYQEVVRAPGNKTVLKTSRLYV